MFEAVDATGIGDVGIAQRAIALAVLREIQRDDRDVFALGVGPDVGLGPMQDRVDAQMRARRRRGVELVPEFRRLVAHVPSAFGAARREHPLLGAGRFLVAADAGDQSVEAVFGERELQSFGLARRRSRGRRQGRIDGFDRRAGLDPEIELPFLAVAIAKRVHLRKFLAGIDMQAPGTARGRRRPCAPARSSRWNPCRATTAARASSAARRLRGKCRCSALRARRGGPSAGSAERSSAEILAWAGALGRPSDRAAVFAELLSRRCISGPWPLEAKIL